MKANELNIKQKATKGGLYLVIANILSQFIAIAVNVILARLLLPEDFGLIVLVNTYIGLISVFTNIGLVSSVIFYQNVNNRQISTLFWISLMVALFSFSIVILTSPIATSFYNEPKLTKVVWVAAINILITPFFNIHYKIMERDLEFKLLSKITILSSTLGAVVGVIFAYLGYGVFALVFQMLGSSLFRLILSICMIKWKPEFVFDWQGTKEMLIYSLKMKVSRLIFFFERNIDYLIMGKFFNSQTLGYYAFTYNIMYTPVKRVSYIFSDILFPSFSSIKDDYQKIIQGYFKSIELISLVTFPGMALIAFNAELIIHFIFGAKWSEAIPILEVLCFAGAIQSISQVGGVIFSSTGKPELGIYFAFFRTSMTTISVIIGSYFGIMTVTYLLLISKGLSFGLLLVLIRRYIHFDWIDFFNHIKVQLATVGSLAIVYISFMNLDYTLSWLKFIVMLILIFGITLSYHFKLIKEIYINIKAKV